MGIGKKGEEKKAGPPTETVIEYGVSGPNKAHPCYAYSYYAGSGIHHSWAPRQGDDWAERVCSKCCKKQRLTPEWKSVLVWKDA